MTAKKKKVVKTDLEKLEGMVAFASLCNVLARMRSNLVAPQAAKSGLEQLKRTWRLASKLEKKHATDV